MYMTKKKTKSRIEIDGVDSQAIKPTSNIDCIRSVECNINCCAHLMLEFQMMNEFISMHQFIVYTFIPMNVNTLQV